MFNDDYEITNDGIIHQKKSNIIKYDVEYVNDRYVKYGVLSDEMSYLRLGFIIGSIKEHISKILDVGYGNGAFIHAANSIIPNCYGNDVTGFPLPEKVKFVENIFNDEYDVITFFDVLEHFENIEFVQDLKTKYICISLPWCHFFSEEWFMNWKHRRYDEHLWHFSGKSLDNFMNRMGFTRITEHVNIEDSIRKTTFDYPNILTCIYKKM